MRFVGGIVADPTTAIRGIVAGSTFATYELLAYMFDEAVKLQTQLGKQGQVTIHVDDVAVTVDGATPIKAAMRLGYAADSLVNKFEVELELPFDREKAFVISNDDTTARLAARRLEGCLAP